MTNKLQNKSLQKVLFIMTFIVLIILVGVMEPEPVEFQNAVSPHSPPAESNAVEEKFDERHIM